MDAQNPSMIELTEKDKLPEPTVKLSIACLGPSAVGKTSTLTVMHKSFRDKIVKTDFKVLIDDESYAIMKQHEEELNNLVKNNFDVPDNGLPSTEDPKNLNFILTREKWRSRDSLGVEFLDVPGGWLQHDQSSANYQTYFNQVKNSGAVIIPIDSLALMEEEGKYHQEKNDPQSVTKMIATAYEDLPKDEKRLVLFIPVKCETYVKTEPNQKRLGEEVKKGYAELINKVLRPKGNVAVVITPVQTVGCVVCGGAKIDLDTGEWKGWNLNKIKVEAEMETLWEDQPLRYLLRFLIHQFMKKREGGIFGKINTLLGANSDLHDALKRFAKGRITTPPFEIIQGDDLLQF